MLTSLVSLGVSFVAFVSLTVMGIQGISAFTYLLFKRHSKSHKLLNASLKSGIIGVIALLICHYS